MKHCNEWKPLEVGNLPSDILVANIMEFRKKGKTNDCEIIESTFTEIEILDAAYRGLKIEYRKRPPNVRELAEKHFKEQYKYCSKIQQTRLKDCYYCGYKAKETE